MTYSCSGARRWRCHRVVETPAGTVARRYLDEGRTPLESFLLFGIASPLARVYLILLPLLVLAFPVHTLAKAGWEWFDNSRVNVWYPRITAIESDLVESSLAELMARQDFLVGHSSADPRSVGR